MNKRGREATSIIWNCEKLRREAFFTIFPSPIMYDF